MEPRKALSDFGEAQFSAGASLGEAQFCGVTNFGRAKFSRGTTFGKAQFSGHAFAGPNRKRRGPYAHGAARPGSSGSPEVGAERVPDPRRRRVHPGSAGSAVNCVGIRAWGCVHAASSGVVP